jgi:hypothetical protein
MPRYFFNVHGTRPLIDEEGEELADNEVAWREATIIAGEIFREIDGALRPGEVWTLEVADENRKSVYFIDIKTREAD